MKYTAFFGAFALIISSMYGQSNGEENLSKTKDEIEQEYGYKAESEYGLVISKGGINGSDGSGGYALFGNPNSGHVNIDNNEIQAKASQTAFGQLYLNY